MKTITKEYICFMQNKSRNTKAYTNEQGTEIIVLDKDNFYKEDTELFKSELKSDLISAALLRCDFTKIPIIEDAVNNTKVTFII